MPAATCCPHCDAHLTRTEIADGWCESCGKKVPFWLANEARHDPHQMEVAALLRKKQEAEAATESEGMTAGQVVMTVVFVLVVLFLIAGALAGDKTAIRGVAKIVGGVVVILLIAVFSVVFRVIGSLFQR